MNARSFAAATFVAAAAACTPSTSTPPATVPAAPVSPPAVSAPLASPAVEALNERRQVGALRVRFEAAQRSSAFAELAGVADEARSLSLADPSARRARDQMLAAAALFAGRGRDALAIATRLTADDAGRADAVAHGLLVDARLATGDVEGAVAAAEAMMGIMPGLPAYARAARLRYVTGDVEGSLEMWREAFRAGGDKDALGRAYAACGAGDTFLFGAGNIDEAARSYEAALAASADDVPAIVGLARTKLARGDRQGALALVGRVGAEAKDPEVLDVVAAAGDDAARAAALKELDAVAARAPRAAVLVAALYGHDLEATVTRARRLVDDAGALDDHEALAFALFMRAGGVADPDALAAARQALSQGTPDLLTRARMGLVLRASPDAAESAKGAALLTAVTPHARALPPRLSALVIAPRSRP